MSKIQKPQLPARPRLILVVEDEVLISLDVETGLKDAGFLVAVARSCVEAMAFLANIRPDAAILDVQLTDGECIHAAEHLAAQSVPFIVHSALLPKDIHPAFRSGKFISKPSATPDLVEAIRKAVAGLGTF
jgi:CheY-like chemotaxis protein